MTWSPYLVVMITGLDFSQQIFVISMLRTLKSSLKHRRKHVLRSLQQYGDHALESLRSVWEKNYFSIPCPGQIRLENNMENNGLLFLNKYS